MCAGDGKGGDGDGGGGGVCDGDAVLGLRLVHRGCSMGHFPTIKRQRSVLLSYPAEGSKLSFSRNKKGAWKRARARLDAARCGTRQGIPSARPRNSTATESSSSVSRRTRISGRSKLYPSECSIIRNMNHFVASDKNRVARRRRE